MNIKLKIINPQIQSRLPEYATENSSGLDISSASLDSIVLGPMDTGIVPTNLIIEIPAGFEGQIRPRSGLALKHNIGIINSPGTIDADYRGELKILLTNFGKQPFTINFGDRIAQLVICRVERVTLKIDENLSETDRSSGGFGHTGV